MLKGKTSGNLDRVVDNFSKSSSFGGGALTLENLDLKFSLLKIYEQPLLEPTSAKPNQLRSVFMDIMV